LNIIVCDDEIVSLKSIISYLNKLKQPDFHITTVNSAQKLIAYLKKDKEADILILDIDLGDDNGIDIAKKIKRQYPNVLIIFVTGYIDFAGDIFEADPIYLLVKPVKIEKLKLALDKAFQQIEKRKSLSVQIYSKGKMFNVNTRDILYIESSARRIKIYNISTIHHAYIKLNDIESKLPDCFIRCHQSFLVNMSFITGIKARGFVLQNGEVIPISQSRLKKAINLYTHYLGGSLCQL